MKLLLAVTLLTAFVSACDVEQNSTDDALLLPPVDTALRVCPTPPGGAYDCTEKLTQNEQTRYLDQREYVASGPTYSIDFSASYLDGDQCKSDGPLGVFTLLSDKAFVYEGVLPHENGQINVYMYCSLAPEQTYEKGL